ncbi:MAG: hypothetical protein QOF13_2662 [Solirubrobacterales bacterium]|nr:hypothetical protein [Solirubrobacterales bacterium]
MVNVGCGEEGECQRVGDRFVTLGCGEGQDQLAIALADAEIEERAAPGLGGDDLLQPVAYSSVATKAQV